MGIEHAAEVVDGYLHIGRTEDDPTNDDKEEGKPTNRQVVDEGMVKSPADKGPVAAMPKSAEQKDGKVVETTTDFTFSIATQRDIDVVFEPTHQGDVPPTPKVLQRSGKVGTVEVAGNVDSEEACRTHSHIAVA